MAEAVKLRLLTTISHLLRVISPEIFDFECIHDTTSLDSGAAVTLVVITSTGCRIASSDVMQTRRLPGGVRQDGVEFAMRIADRLKTNLGAGVATVDEYLQDQLIIFMALAKGKSRIVCNVSNSTNCQTNTTSSSSPPLPSYGDGHLIELHTLTAIHIAHVLTGAAFTVCREEKANDGADQLWPVVVIECEGIGYSNKSIQYQRE